MSFAFTFAFASISSLTCAKYEAPSVRAAVLSRGELFTRHRQRRIDDWISRAGCRHRREHPHRLKRDDSTAHWYIQYFVLRINFLFRHALNKAPHLFLFAVHRERGCTSPPRTRSPRRKPVKDAFHHRVRRSSSG